MNQMDAYSARDWLHVLFARLFKAKFGRLANVCKGFFHGVSLTVTALKGRISDKKTTTRFFLKNNGKYRLLIFNCLAKTLFHFPIIAPQMTVRNNSIEHVCLRRLAHRVYSVLTSFSAVVLASLISPVP